MHFEPGNWLFDFRCDWLQLRAPNSWNWLTFNLINIETEWSRYLGNFEATIVVLGFGVRVVYNYDRHTETREEIDKSMKDFMSETSVLVPHDEYTAMKEKVEKWDNYVKESIR